MKKQKITQQDYLKAHRKASREEEIEQHGRPARFRAVHKEMLLVYNRLATTNDGGKQFTKGYLRNINIKYDAKKAPQTKFTALIVIFHRGTTRNRTGDTRIFSTNN